MLSLKCTFYSTVLLPSAAPPTVLPASTALFFFLRTLSLHIIQLQSHVPITCSNYTPFPNHPTKTHLPYPTSMWLNLSQIFTRLSTDPAVRAILLTGAGPRAFTAGLDVHAASQSGLLSQEKNPLDPARTAYHSLHHIASFQACITAVERCAKPTIAVLHGICYGLALDIALAADVRLAAADARLSVKEVDIGIAADIGTLTRLPKSVGSLSWVKDVTLTARVFGAEEALGVGLVSGVYAGGKDEAVGEGLAKAVMMAGKSPVAVQGTKELVNYSRDRPTEDGELLCLSFSFFFFFLRQARAVVFFFFGC